MPGDKPNFIVTTPGKTIVTFKPDGRVELGEGISPSEAAKEMFAILEPMLRHAARPVSAGEADASPAPAAMPSEEEIKEIIANGCRCDRDCENHGLDHCGCTNESRAILSLFQERFAPILAEKERLSQKVRELALLLDRQMGTPCEQIRHHHAYADLTAIAEKRQDEADQQAARADAAEARALAAESALAAARGEYQALRAAYDASLEIWSQHAAIRAKGE